MTASAICWTRRSIRFVGRALGTAGRASGTFALMPELRAALHSLRRAPGFTLIAVTTLSLGVGANTSMFGVLNGILLRPAPYPDSDRLDCTFRVTPQNARGGISPADYLDLKAEASGYGELAAYAYADSSLSEPGRPAELARGLRISANLFSTLGSRPRLGRDFRAVEELPGNDRVVILSHLYWQKRFGGDEKVLGRAVRLNGQLHEIVGVLPPGFSDWRHLESVELFQPLGLTEREARDRSTTPLQLVGRRSRSLSRPQAEAFIATFGRRLASRHPAIHGEANWRAVPFADSVLPENRRRLLALLVGLSGLVLLIACSNLANLLLARTVARARELAVRSALGASRSQVLRPLILESLLLAGAACGGAVFVSHWSFHWLAAQGGLSLPFDWRVLGWALATCLSTAVVFAAAPALFVLRLDPNEVLQSGSRGLTGDARQRRLRQLLVIGQYALATMLLAGAALFLHGLNELRSRRDGWSSERLVTGNLLLPAGTYPGAIEMAAFQQRALRRLESLPGVVAASLSDSMPFLTLGEPRRFLVADRERAAAPREVAVRVNGVSTRYFETVGTRLLAGRRFDEADRLGSPKVFIISQAMAHAAFAGESPLGRRIARADGTGEWGQIVGVAADVQSISPDPSPAAFQLYHPIAQEPHRQLEIAVRTAGVVPPGLADEFRTAMMELDADLPVQRLQTAGTAIAQATRQWELLSRILFSFAALALGLASLGLYAVVARSVALRMTEFGIRLALGARPLEIAGLVLASGARLAAVGSLFGLLGAWGVSRLLLALFPGMQTGRLPVLAGISLLLVVVALVASYQPARWAAKTSIAQTLRAE